MKKKIGDDRNYDFSKIFLFFLKIIFWILYNGDDRNYDFLKFLFFSQNYPLDFI